MKKETQWKRKCPKCNKDLFYIKEKGMIYAEKIGRKCRSCTQMKTYEEKFGVNADIERKKRGLPNIGKKSNKKGKTYEELYGIKRAKKIKKRIVKYLKTRRHSIETKEKMKKSKLGNLNPSKSQDVKEKISISLKKSKLWNIAIKNPERGRKIRLKLIDRIQNNKYNGNQIYPIYNPKSIPILEQKAKELGITDLQHAENGGEFYIKELGYWVDGYSKEKNIVIEYYEKHHNKRKEKDKKRKKEIIDFLKCKFFIIKE